MAITKVSGHVIEPTTNITSHNINSSGIITATRFDGPLGVGLTDGNFSGIVTTAQLNVTGVSTFRDDVEFHGSSGITSMTWDKSISRLHFKDSADLSFGDGNDLIINHTGSHSFIQDAGSGNLNILSDSLYLQNTSGNKKYLRALTGAQVDLYHNDNIKITTTNTGAVVTGICTATDFSGAAGGAADFPNGLTGTTATFSGNVTVGGVLTYEDVTNIDSVGIVTARTGIKVLAGGINAVGVVTATTGIRVNAGGLDVVGVSTFNNNIMLGDDDRVIFGDGGLSDAHVRYDGTHLQFGVASGTFRVSADGVSFVNYAGTKTLAAFNNNGSNDLYHNNTKRLETTNTGVTVSGDFVSTGNIDLEDNVRIKLGTSDDLQIWHSGSESFISDAGTGGITMYADHLKVQSPSAENIIVGTQNGTVDLYYDNAVKLTTSSTGISVTGEVAASQDFPVTKPVLDFNFAAEKKLDPRFTFYRRGTASYVDKKGIVRYASSNEPRFDHHPTSGASLGLLIEKQQSNYQPYSVDMTQGANSNAVTVINDAAIAPDGTMSASKIIGSDNQSTSQRLGWGTQGVNSSNYTMWSIWLKSEETSCIIQVYSNTYTIGADHLNVELADGTTGGHNNNDGTFRYNLEKYPNKWWRLSWGGNGNAGGNSGGMYVAVVPAMNSARAANTGSAHGKVWYAWGLQEEVSTESRIATSYIPTYGAAATRYGDHVTMDGEDFDDFFDRFQGTIINEHSNALQSYTGGGSAWEFNNDQFQTNIVTQTGSGYSHSGYPGAHASIFGDRGSNGSGNGSGSDYMQAFGPNFADGLNQATSTGNGRYPHNNIPDYTRYYKTWIDGMSYDLTPSTNILRTASGGEAPSDTTNTQNISLHNISKFEIGGGATDKAYADFYGRIKRWVYYDKVVTQNQLANLTAQLPQSYL